MRFLLAIAAGTPPTGVVAVDAVPARPTKLTCSPDQSLSLSPSGAPPWDVSCVLVVGLATEPAVATLRTWPSGRLCRRHRSSPASLDWLSDCLAAAPESRAERDSRRILMRRTIFALVSSLPECDLHDVLCNRAPSGCPRRSVSSNSSSLEQQLIKLELRLCNDARLLLCSHFSRLPSLNSKTATISFS